MGTYVAEFGAETEALISCVVRLRAESFEAGRKTVGAFDIVFDGPPGPDGGRFIECERVSDGTSLSVGEWIERADGTWALRVAGSAEDLATYKAKLSSMEAYEDKRAEAFVQMSEAYEAIKAKLARVEALLTAMEQDWICDPDLVDDLRAVRAALEDK